MSYLLYTRPAQVPVLWLPRSRGRLPGRLPRPAPRVRAGRLHLDGATLLGRLHRSRTPGNGELHRLRLPRWLACQAPGATGSGPSHGLPHLVRRADGALQVLVQVSHLAAAPPTQVRYQTSCHIRGPSVRLLEDRACSLSAFESP